MSERAESSQMLSFAFPFLAGLAAWVGTLLSPLLLVVKGAASFVAGPEAAEFLSRPYVFPPLCMLLAAIIQGAVKVFLAFKDNQLRRDNAELLAQNIGQARRIAELEPHAPRHLKRK